MSGCSERKTPLTWKYWQEDGLMKEKADAQTSAAGQADARTDRCTDRSMRGQIDARTLFSLIFTVVLSVFTSHVAARPLSARDRAPISGVPVLYPEMWWLSHVKHKK